MCTDEPFTALWISAASKIFIIVLTFMYYVADAKNFGHFEAQNLPD